MIYMCIPYISQTTYVRQAITNMTQQLLSTTQYTITEHIHTYNHNHNLTHIYIYAFLRTLYFFNLTKKSIPKIEVVMP
jgi:hypothetical protein